MARLAVVAAVLACVLLAACAHRQGPSTLGARPDDAPGQGDAYYLPTCPMCDRRLGYARPAVDAVIDGRMLRFCSDECLAEFRREPAAGTARADAAIVRDQSPHYPLRTSIVSGRPLGTQAAAVVWRNRLFRVHGEAERAQLLRDPAAYLHKLDAEVIRVQRPRYGLPDKCPVQGDILESDVPQDIVVANRMIRVCCSQCARVVRARPYQYIALIDHANKEASEGR